MTRETTSTYLPPDCVEISGLRLTSRIGVPPEERQCPQSLTASITMHPRQGSLAGLGDSIEQTVDYHAVSLAVRKLAASGERKLIETLAEEIVDRILSDFPVHSATVEIRKFILSDTNHVAVKVSKVCDTDISTS